MLFEEKGIGGETRLGEWVILACFVHCHNRSSWWEQGLCGALCLLSHAGCYIEDGIAKDPSLFPSTLAKLVTTVVLAFSSLVLRGVQRSHCTQTLHWDVCVCVCTYVCILFVPPFPHVWAPLCRDEYDAREYGWAFVALNQIFPGRQIAIFSSTIEPKLQI